MAGLVEGKIAFVTGGAMGIGRASALLFAREGARVAVCDRDPRGGRETVAAIESNGGVASFVEADVSCEADVAAAIEHCLSTYGRIDCALNNAGVMGAMGMVPDISLDGWRKTFDVNLGGVFLCMKYELPPMQEQGSGAIVNMASAAGMIAVPGMSPYCASKHAVLGLTKTAAVENARTGVRVNAVCPGSTDTPMIQATIDGNPAMEKLIKKSLPGGRFGQPSEIAEAAIWLCSDRAGFVSGESMLVDGASVAR